MYEDSCGCRKFNISDSVDATGAESLCSRYSTSRGPGQKVISYSLYGKAVNALLSENFSERLRESLPQFSLEACARFTQPI